MKFYVFRLYTQMKSDNSGIEDKTATYVYEDETSALKQYYKLLAADIDDEKKFSVLCAVMTDMGAIIARQRFVHAAPAITENLEIADNVEEA